MSEIFLQVSSSELRVKSRGSKLRLPPRAKGPLRGEESVVGIFFSFCTHVCVSISL